MRLISLCHVDKSASILNVGAGATMLVDKLIMNGYDNIIANDISALALDTLKTRLGKDLSRKVRWIVDDLIRPDRLLELETVDLWHDRAVLHFFTEPSDQDAYFWLLRRLVGPDGFVIIAAFNPGGATKCSGLPVHRYDLPMLQQKLGSMFVLQEAFDYTFRTPSGDTRPYIYTLFRRNSMK